MTTDVKSELRRIFAWNKALDCVPAYSADGANKPMSISRFYGPFGVVLPGNLESVYPQDIYGATVNVGNYVLPNYPAGNPLLSGEWGHFLCSRITLNSYVSVTYVPWEGVPANLATNALPAGPLFGTQAQNGGAICFNNWADAPQGNAVTRPHLCAELDLYNNTEGYSITQGPIGVELFAGAFYGETHLPEAAGWRRGTEIEPRLYITDLQLGGFFGQEDITEFKDNVRVAAWVNVTMIGHTVSG